MNRLYGVYGAVKSVNITPPACCTLTGYLERDHGAEGIKDELYAKVLVLFDGNTKIVLVTTDLAGVDNNFTKKIRTAVEEKTDINGNNIMISASHTHSGPAACRVEGNYNWVSSKDFEVDRAYYLLLKKSIANAIIWSNNNLGKVKIGIGKDSLVGLGSNRRNQAKPFDTEVKVMRVDSEDDKPIAILVNYACHPTVLSAENYLVSGDYPSYMMKGIERVYPNCEAMFLQGAAGDISTRHNRRGSTFKEAKRMGYMLSGKALEIATKIETSSYAELNSAIIPLNISVRKFASEEECLKNIKKAKKILEELKQKGAPQNQIRTAVVTLQGAERNYTLKKSLKIKEFVTEMQLLRLGNAVIVSVPGELFNELGLRIKSLSDQHDIFVAGYTNDYIGYILTPEIYEEAGYESGVAMVNKTAGDMIVKVAEGLLKKNV